MTLRAFGGHYIPHMAEERLSINQWRVNEYRGIPF